MSTQPVVAIDGPAASGKSSTARAVAQALGWVHLDSGALYRALTQVFLELPEPALDADAILTEADRRGLALRLVDGDYVPWLGGCAADGIRTPAVTARVSEVAAIPALRAWVNARLRDVARTGGRPIVMDGRDIGTAVFPDATLKLYLTAAPEVRAKRRLLERHEGREPSSERMVEETFRLSARDAFDAGRPVAPLRKADDAIELDTSGLGFDEQVAHIVALVRARPSLAGFWG